MKRILYISGKDSGYLNQGELPGLQGYKWLQTDCLTSLKYPVAEKKPDLLIWGNNAEISSEILILNPELFKIPMISIIAKSEIGNWKPLHPKHQYLINSHSQADLLQKIEFLLKQKKDKKEENRKINRASIPNIEALKIYIEEKGERIILDKNKIIFRENRHSSFIYLISKGLVKTSRMDQLGKELITGVYRENELLGLYGFHKNPTCPEMATTLEPSRLYRILHKEFRDILQENPGLSLDIAQYLTDTVLRLKSQLLEMAYASVLKKTSNTILQFANELQNPDFQELRISRTDLASIAGISPESFIRSLSSLKKEGIIAIKGRKINILKPERLQEIT